MTAIRNAEVTELLNVLLASGVNVYRLRSRWKKTFRAHALIKMT